MALWRRAALLELLALLAQIGAKREVSPAVCQTESTCLQSVTGEWRCGSKAARGVAGVAGVAGANRDRSGIDSRWSHSGIESLSRATAAEKVR